MTESTESVMRNSNTAREVGGEGELLRRVGRTPVRHIHRDGQFKRHAGPYERVHSREERTIMRRTERQTGKTHSHIYTIADDEAVEILVAKLETSGIGQVNREKLRDAFETAAEEYKSTDEKERKSFFHGMLTGYAVALKVGGPPSRRNI